MAIEPIILVEQRFLSAIQQSWGSSASETLSRQISKRSPSERYYSGRTALDRACNCLERLNREIRRRTRVVGSFPDGNSALMLRFYRNEAGIEVNRASYTGEAIGTLIQP